MGEQHWVQNEYRSENDIINYTMSFWSIDQYGAKQGFHFAEGPATGFDARERVTIAGHIQSMFQIYHCSNSINKIVIVKGVSHAPHILLQKKMRIQNRIDNLHDFGDEIVTRSKKQYALEQTEPLLLQLNDISVVSLLMRQTYTSTKTGWLFKPASSFVCQNCGFGKQKDSLMSMYSSCPTCTTKAQPYGHIFIHDQDIANTAISAAGGTRACKIIDTTQFVTEALNIMSYNEYLTPYL